MTNRVLNQLRKVLGECESTKVNSDRAFGFYWTRKSSWISSQLIAEFSSPDSVVLDPFLGSGSTAIGNELATGERLFVGCEINELPLVNLKLTLGQYSPITPSEVAIIQNALDNLRNLYSFETPSGRIFLDKIIHNLDQSTLMPIAFHVFDENSGSNRVVEIGSSDFSYLNNSYFEKISKFNKVAALPLETNSRIAVKQGMLVSDVFGPFGYEALTQFKKDTEDNLFARICIGAGLHLCRLTDQKSQSQFPFWFPKQNIYEKSVHSVLDKQLKQLLKLQQQLEFQPVTTVPIDIFTEYKSSKQKHSLLLLGDVRETLNSELPAESVDLIITDPPYFDQVAYSEYLKLWEFFTGFKSNLEQEIVESSRVGSGKSRQLFLKELSEAFTAIRKTAKTGSKAFIYFKDSKPKNVHDFICALGWAGFKYEGQVHLPKKSYTYKQNSTPETTVGGDSIMYFSASSANNFAEPTSELSLQEVDDYFLEMFISYIEANGPSTITEALDNEILEKLFNTGCLKNMSSLSHLVSVSERKLKYLPTTRQWSLN